MDHTRLRADCLSIIIPLGALQIASKLYLSLGAQGRCFSLVDLDDRAWLTDYFTNNKAPVLLIDAKSTLQWLLRCGIDIARPICLSTLHRLQSSRKPPIPEADSVAQAQLLAQKLQLQLAHEISRIEKLGLEKIARLESLVTRAFASMEFHGLPLDRQSWQSLIAAAKAELAQGEVISAAQANKLNKLVSAYGDNFLRHIRLETGRLHGCFEPLGTSTGRSSCHSPNLQNLPSAQAFQQCIKAPPGRSLVSADYAGCELRILAHLSQDPVFLQAFAKNVDLHAEVASKLFGVTVNKSENTQLRQRAKAINFGLIYGMGATSLARQIELPVPEAQALLQRYFVEYPKIKNYLNHSVEQARIDGYAQTLWGRKLIFQDHFGPDSTEDISRLARNMPIQGTAADMIKLAMISIQERLHAEFKQAFLVNMIHDELIVECATEDSEKIGALLQQEMENAQLTMVPQVKPKVDVHVDLS